MTMPGNFHTMPAYAYNFALQNNWPSSLETVGQFFYILLLVAFVGLLAYYSTKLLASARFRRGGGRHNLELIESAVVGAQTAVQIIHAGGRYFLIGVTKETITLLAELDESQIIQPEARKKLMENGFDKVLQRFLHKETE